MRDNADLKETTQFVQSFDITYVFVCLLPIGFYYMYITLSFSSSNPTRQKIKSNPNLEL